MIDVFKEAYEFVEVHGDRETAIRKCTALVHGLEEEGATPEVIDHYYTVLEVLHDEHVE